MSNHNHSLELWQHDHVFGQDRKRGGERKTLIVIAITAVMMVVEIVAGIWFGSMALLADGLHMASHAAALTIAAFAYIYARRYAADARFSFGTGKVNALAGFTGAVLLALFALMMAWESIARLIQPVTIAFNQAIVVACLGLAVNTLCMLILGHRHHHDHADDHSHDKPEPQHAPHDHEDHNLRSAYLHVLADAMTSVFAIVALLAGKFYGLNWMDPMMGIVGAILVATWSTGLLVTTSAVLLDRQAPERLRKAIRQCIEDHDDSQVADLHVWSIGPQIYALIISIVAHHPKPVEHYRSMLKPIKNLAHITIEVNRCCDGDEQQVSESASHLPK